MLKLWFSRLGLRRGRSTAFYAAEGLRILVRTRTWLVANAYPRHPTAAKDNVGYGIEFQRNVGEKSWIIDRIVARN